MLGEIYDWRNSSLFCIPLSANIFFHFWRDFPMPFNVEWAAFLWYKARQLDKNYPVLLYVTGRCRNSHAHHHLSLGALEGVGFQRCAEV